MDTTTKMFYIALQDKEFANILSIISDVYTDSISEKTIQKARTIENNFIEYWDENQWVRFVAGFNIENLTKEDIGMIKDEIKDEFSEVKNDKGETQ